MAAKMAPKMKQTLKTFSMQYAHLSVDIQLHHIACIVQWSDSYCWTSLVLHPGIMHTLMSFLGCIGTLMKASCVDMLLTVAFGGVADIITGKWTNALRASHLITTVLLQDLFQSGTKTYQELREYKEAVREHPFDRLWVYVLPNQAQSSSLAVTAYTWRLLLPTPDVIVHQYFQSGCLSLAVRVGDRGRVGQGVHAGQLATLASHFSIWMFFLIFFLHVQ